MKREQDSHCGYCGYPFSKGQPYPKRCRSCSVITYRNPLPVAVVLLPVDGGLLTIRRGIAPQKGRLALPGGFVDWGETWQEAAVRELREETGILIDSEEVTDFRVRSSPSGHIIIFGLVTDERQSRDLPLFTPTPETQERVIITRKRKLAFDLHTQMVAHYFEHNTSSPATG